MESNCFNCFSSWWHISVRHITFLPVDIYVDICAIVVSRLINSDLYKEAYS